MKLEQVLKIAETLKRINSQTMSFATKRELLPLQEQVKKEKEWYNEQYSELLAKYGKKDENDRLIVTEGQIAILDIVGFKKEEKELLEVEVEIAKVKQELIEQFELSGEDWDNLMGVI